MALKPSQVRRRIEASLEQQLGASWNVSTWQYDSFPGLDSREMADGAYVVGLGRSVPDDARQRKSRAARTLTEVRVRMSLTTRPHEPADYDAGANADLLVLRAVLAANSDPELEVRWLSTPVRSVVQSGTLYLAELRFEVAHMMWLA